MSLLSGGLATCCIPRRSRTPLQVRHLPHGHQTVRVLDPLGFALRRKRRLLVAWLVLRKAPDCSPAEKACQQKPTHNSKRCFDVHNFS
jgi:hypothetical protein